MGGYSFLSRSVSCCFAADSPHAWRFEASQDGQSWTTLGAESGQDDWGSREWKTYTGVAHLQAYTYYRWVFDGASSGVSCKQRWTGVWVYQCEDRLSQSVRLPQATCSGVNA